MPRVGRSWQKQDATGCEKEAGAAADSALDRATDRKLDRGGVGGNGRRGQLPPLTHCDQGRGKGLGAYMGHKDCCRGRDSGGRGVLGVAVVVVGLHIMCATGCEGLSARPELRNGAFVPLSPSSQIRVEAGRGGDCRSRMAAAFFWKSNKKMESPSRSDHSFVCSQCHDNNHIVDYQHDNDSINKSNKKMAVPRPIPPFGGTRSSAAYAATALRMSKDDSNVGGLRDGVARDPLKDASETGRDAAVGLSELPLYNDDNPEKSRGEAKKDKPKNAQKRTKLKVRNSVSETHLDRILRLGSMGKVNGTNSLARGLGGYQTLVAVKTAIGVCTCVCLSMCVCACACVHMCVCVCWCIYVCKCIRACVRVYAFVDVRDEVCVREGGEQMYT